ncbi:uncharacterized protein LOC119098099, partial [Pollicipes pollicipes]|uniref:uncharacterized protein LOC119098099 n=1 Tax=Pollicipes pollicipes TaxID=41117 RepID=UPI0018854BA3
HFRADDATVYPPAPHPPQPAAVAWWRRGSTDLAVVGGRQGEIEFVDLSSGERVGGTYVRHGIARLDVLHEEVEGRVYLLISSGVGEQWRLLLEHRAAGYVVPLDALQSAPTAADLHETASELVRAKLNTLRQLSREKLGSLQQRWADSRLFRRSVQRDETGPESLTGLLGETRVRLQAMRAGDVLAGYYGPTSTLSVHLADLEAVPLSIHKLPPSVGHLLVTDAVVFITDAETTRLFLVSYSFSQSDMDLRRFNEDAVLSVFDLEPADGLLALLPTAEHAPPPPARLRPHLAGLPQSAMRGCLVVTRRGVAVCEPLTSPEAALLQIGTSAGAGTHLLERVHKLFSVPVGRLYETLGDLKLEEREFTQALAYYRLTKKPHMAVVHKFAAYGYSSQLLHYATILLGGVSEGLLLADRRQLSNLALLAHVEMTLRSGAPNDADALEKFLHVNRHYDAGLALQYTLLARQWDCVRFLLAERHQHQRLLACLTASEPAAPPPGDDPLMHEAVHDPGLRAVLMARPRLAGLYVLRLCERVPRLPVAALRRLARLTDPLSAELRPVTHALLGQRPSGRSLSVSQPTDGEPEGGGGGQELHPLQPDDLVDLHLHVLLHLVRAAQLGLGAAGACPHPCLVEALAYRRVVRLAAGQYHSLALTDDGRLFAWGWNVFGQCGRSGVADVLSPRPVRGLAGVRVSAVAAGYAHSAALTDDGRVLVFGCNAYGQLGDGTTRKRAEPAAVELPEPAVHLACGFFCCVAVLRSGRVLRWGLDPQSVRLGAQTLKKSAAAQAPSAPVEPTLATQAGTFTPETRDHLRPADVDTSDVEGRVVSAAGGAQHTIYLTADGRLYAQGRNLDGQLGVGGRQEAARLSEVSVPGGRAAVAVACGADFSLVLTEDGVVLGCGSNSYGQLGRLPAADKLDDAKLVLLKNRRLLRLPQGQNSSDTLQEVVAAGGRPAPLEVAFSVTERHECALSRPAEFAGDAERLHAVIGLFQGCYDSAQLLAKCLDMGCLYAAARVCCVAGKHAKALEHHLQAVRAEAATDSRNGDGEALVAAVTGVVADYLALPADGSVAGGLLLRRLLLQLVTFWLDCGLDVARLERLLEPRLERLAHPLAVLLFGGSADMQLSDGRIAALFGQLSAGFCVRLCALVCQQIGAGRICRELLPVLGELTLPAGRPATGAGGLHLRP